MRFAKKPMVALLALAVISGFAACGSSSDTTGEEEAAVSGEFAVVADAPAGYPEVTGEAELERSDGGTELSLDVSGLKPKTAYVAHLHTGGCDQADPGGPHFQFEKGGSEEPPNEIHLEFTTDANGEGEAEAESKREVPVGEAGSVVIHTAEEEEEPHHEMAAFVHEGHSHSEMVACAELEGMGGGSGETTSGGNADVPTIVVRDGEPVGGIKELEYSAGEQVRFRVSSDEAEEIHVHGYDFSQNVPAGGTIEFDFPAELEGIYEAELEEQGGQIAELRINP